MTRIRPFIAFLATLSLALPVKAAFQLTPQSVRSSALASSFMPGEAASLFTNPAGIAQMASGQASFMYAKPFAGLPGVALGLSSMALALPTPIATFGLGLALFDASGLKQERTFAISLARQFVSGRLKVGLTGKQLHHSYKVGSDPLAQRDPIFQNGTSKNALSLDAGLMMHVIGPLKLAVAARNLNEPDVGLASEDRVPREIQAGAYLEINGFLRLSSDLFYRDAGFGPSSQQILPLFGAETRVSEQLSIRLGANPLEFTGGLGFRTGRLGIDYALVLHRNLLENNLGSHRVGMSWTFGGGAKKVKPWPEPKPEP